MLSSKSDYVFVTLNALARISIQGKPLPVRSSKLPLIGEDAAYILEAIRERDFCANEFTYRDDDYRIGVDVYNTAILDISHFISYFINLNTSISNLVQNKLWVRGDRVEAFYGRGDFVVEMVYDSRKSGGDEKFNEAYQKYVDDRQAAEDAYKKYMDDARAEPASQRREAERKRDAAIAQNPDAAWDANVTWANEMDEIWDNYAAGMQRNKKSYDNAIATIKNTFASEFAALQSGQYIRTDMIALAYEWNTNVMEMTKEHAELAGESKAGKFLTKRPLAEIYSDILQIEPRFWRHCELFSPSYELLRLNFLGLNALSAHSRSGSSFRREPFTETYTYITATGESIIHTYDRPDQAAASSLLYSQTTRVYTQEEQGIIHYYTTTQTNEVDSAKIYVKIGKRYETEWIKGVYATVIVEVSESVNNLSRIARHVLRVELNAEGIIGGPEAVDEIVDSLHKELDGIEKGYNEAKNSIDKARDDAFSEIDATYNEAEETANEVLQQAYQAAHNTFMGMSLQAEAETNTKIKNAETPEEQQRLYEEYVKKYIEPAKKEEERAREAALREYNKAISDAELRRTNDKARYTSSTYTVALNREQTKRQNQRQAAINQKNAAIDNYLNNHTDCDINNREKYSFTIPIGQFTAKKLSPTEENYNHTISVRVLGVQYLDVVYDLPSNIPNI